MFIWDPAYILVIIGAVLCLIASSHVRSVYRRYSKEYSRSQMTGAQAAERILLSQGINDVTIREVQGDLSDHYDPRNLTLNLSSEIYHSTSVAAIGVAAHECGHAIQDAEHYSPLRFRTAFVPVANFGSRFSWLLIILGLIFGTRYAQGNILIQIGILMFSLVVFFQLITLPVEFNASSRALALLQNQGILYSEEAAKTKKVLSAAALTYVAGTAASILQLLRLIILFGGRRRD